MFSGIFVGATLDRARVWKRSDSKLRSIVAKGIGIITPLGYILSLFGVLFLTPDIYYQSCMGRETLLIHVFDIPVAFWGLIVAQCGAVGVVSIVVSTEIVPAGIVTERELSRFYTESPETVFEIDKKKLQIHVQNWRQYGTWLISLFVSVGWAGSLVFITDVAPFGRSFIFHAVVLFGGGLLLTIGFISVKLSRLEQHF